MQKGNQVQLSTKKEISVEEVEAFVSLIKYLGQLVVFVSSATISKWDTIEKGTDSPSKRFNTFKISKELNIPTALYMKPVLKGITKQDIELYKDIIRKYGIRDVVVGSIFGEKKTEETVHFSDKETLWYNPIPEELEIKRRFMELGNLRVFSRSSEVMQYYKDKIKGVIR